MNTPPAVGGMPIVTIVRAPKRCARPAATCAEDDHDRHDRPHPQTVERQ